MADHASSITFNSFGLSDALIQALDDVGYETPSAIQEQCITHLLERVMMSLVKLKQVQEKQLHFRFL